MAGERSSGTVKWFSGQKGFGFVAPENGGDDLFVHQTDIRSDGFRTLREGQRVEFVVETGDDGRSKAVAVAVVVGNYNSGGGRGGRRGGYGGRGRGRIGGGGGEGVECYNCGRSGHFARDCYRGGGGGGGDGGGNWGYRGGGGGRGRSYSGRSGGRGGGSGACFNCGEEGHFARDCVN